MKHILLCKQALTTLQPSRSFVVLQAATRTHQAKPYNNDYKKQAKPHPLTDLEKFQSQHLTNLKTQEDVREKQTLIINEEKLNKFDKCLALQTLWRQAGTKSDLVDYYEKQSFISGVEIPPFDVRQALYSWVLESHPPKSREIMSTSQPCHSLYFLRLSLYFSTEATQFDLLSLNIYFHLRIQIESRSSIKAPHSQYSSVPRASILLIFNYPISRIIDYREIAQLCKSLGFSAHNELADNMYHRLHSYARARKHTEERLLIMQDALTYKELFKLDLKGDKWVKLLQVFVDGIDYEGTVQKELQIAVQWVREMGLKKGEDSHVEQCIVRKVTKLFVKMEGSEEAKEKLSKIAKELIETQIFTGENKEKLQFVEQKGESTAKKPAQKIEFGKVQAQEEYSLGNPNI